MKNSLFRRCLALLLVVIMALSAMPTAFATEDYENYDEINSMNAEGVVGMTASVGSNVITINVNRVGISGTATLYRVAANEYFSGDELTGKSTDIVSSGTVIGEYSCGSTQEFIINRYERDGSDNLYDKYYLIQNGTILCGPVYASTINSMRDKPAFEQDTKKGLTWESDSGVEDAVDMGCSNTVVNLDLSTLIIANEDANGNPRDLSKRSDVITYESNGKTYYFNADYVRGQDNLICSYSKAGINVTMVIICWAKTLTSDYPSSLKYFNQTNRQTLAFNTANDLGMDYWIAAMEFLADRYSKSAKSGLVDKFIIGNEIDYTYDWYLLEPLTPDENGYYSAVDMDIFMEEFARTFRLANLAVKKYNASAKVCVSLTHNWALNSADAYGSNKKSVRQNSYAPKDIVDWLVKYEGARGNYDWGLAVHPYPVGTNPSNPLKTDVAGTYGKPITGDPDTSPWITVANLELYQLYLQRPENMYNGEVRTVSLTETSVLSLAPGASGYTQSTYEQAASIAQTYYRAANIPCIDQVAYFQMHDQTTTSYKLGLKTADGVEKPAYNVWKYIDTNKSFVFANKYLKYINSTASSYEELMPAVASDFSWSTMWDEDNIVTRTITGGNTERTLATDKDTYGADDQIMVTATGDVGDTIELYKADDDIATKEPIYSYPVVGSQNGQKYKSGGTYDLIAYGELSVGRTADAALKQGNYKVVLRRGDTDGTLVKNITVSANYSMDSTSYGLKTNKDTYASGENIIVTATGNTKCWAGLYKADDKYGTGNTTSIYWYYVNDPGAGQTSGKPTILQTRIHNSDSSNPGNVLSPGEYILYLFDETGGDSYNVVMSKNLTVVAADVDGLASISYVLEDDTDGYANGVVTIEKDEQNESARDCVMYWADAEGKPLEGYTSLAKFKLTGTRTVYQMPSHTVIPPGAKKLIAYASDGSGYSEECVSTDLPENCTYDLSETPIVEFQIVSDTHVTTDSGATGEVKDANKHFVNMLDDVKNNSQSSIGIFIAGDIVNTGSSAEFNKVLNLYMAAKNSGLGADLHLAIGNHDWNSGNPNGQFQKYANLLNDNIDTKPENVYYDEVVNGYHFIYLGGEQAGLRASLSEEQLSWFDTRMAEISAEDPDQPVFVFLHQSFYNTVAGSLPGQGWDGITNEAALKKIMKKYDQIYFFNGHSHWDLNSESNMYPGDDEIPVALNTASVGYLWTSYDVMGGEFMDGTQGYFVRVYEDKVVFLGRDFENSLYIPSATYVIKRNTVNTEQDSYDLVINETANLAASSVSGGALSYRSSDTDVVTVTDDGTLILKDSGTATITITSAPTNTLVVSKKNVTINVTEDGSQYTVTFKNWDGTVLSTGSYYYGDTVTLPENPTKASNETYQYVFAGWDKPVVVCNGSTEYTAVFNEEYINYTVTFKNWDGTVIKAVEYHYGDQVEVPETPTREATETTVYVFAGWDKEVTACTGTVEYVATYTEKPNTTVQEDSVVRIFGKTRYLTAFETADALKEELGVDKFQNIVISSGEEFADALSGSYLANQKAAPILLVKNNKDIMNQVRDYVAANLAEGGTVYLLGGEKAIPAAMATRLEGYNVKRLAGATRYETNLEILKEAGVENKDILVCTGKAFADSLSASAVNQPVLLVKDSLNTAQKEFFAGLSGSKIYIIGGEKAVSKKIAGELAAYGEVTRIEGATRYDTSVNIAKEFFPDADSIVLAYGKNFPDGMSGGVLAYSMDAPLILTLNGKEAPAVAYATERNIKSGVVLGGPTLILDRSVRKIFRMASDVVIPTK